MCLSTEDGAEEDAGVPEPLPFAAPVNKNRLSSVTGFENSIVEDKESFTQKDSISGEV